MRPIKFKSLLVVGMTTLSSIAITNAFAADPPSQALKGNRIAATKQHKLVQGDLERIYVHKLKIEGVKNSLFENRQADNEAGIEADKRQLAKLKADLKRDKKFLCVDKKTVMCDQHKAIRAANDQKKADKKDLREAKQTLRRDKRQGIEERLAWNTRQVELLEQKIENTELSKDKMVQDRKDYLAYIKDEMDKPHEGSVAVESNRNVFSEYWVMLF